MGIQHSRVEFLTDGNGDALAYKRHDGSTVGVVTAKTDPVTGGVEISVGSKTSDFLDVELLEFPYWPLQVLCPSGSTTTAGGRVEGAGDVIGKVVVIIDSPGVTATLSVQDGAAGAILPLSPAGGFVSAGVVSIDLGFTSLTDAWRVTCGAGVRCIASML